MPEKVSKLQMGDLEGRTPVNIRCSPSGGGKLYVADIASPASSADAIYHPTIVMVCAIANFNLLAMLNDRARLAPSAAARETTFTPTSLGLTSVYLVINVEPNTPWRICCHDSRILWCSRRYVNPPWFGESANVESACHRAEGALERHRVSHTAERPTTILR
jgi:hypothetical protein